MGILRTINRILDLCVGGVALIMVGISSYAVYDGFQVEKSANIAEEIVQLADAEEGDLFRKLAQESIYVVG